MKLLMLTVLAATLLMGCGPSTKIVNSWQEPNASVKADTTSKVFVIALIKDEPARRVIEDQLVRRMKANAVASYNFFTTDMLKEANGDKLEAKLRQEKYDYVLLMRLADVEKETYYVPGTNAVYYRGYGRYYGYGAGMYTTPGYYDSDKNYFVETTVYSVEPDKLLWTGTTKSVNPTNMEKTVAEIADAVAAKMKKDNFLR